MNTASIIDVKVPSIVIPTKKTVIIVPIIVTR